MDFVESIQYEPEFKELCDGLLRLEVAPLVQIYAGKGADQGVDADYMGAYGGVNGRWVFQYKFVHPATDPSQARARLKKMFVVSAKGKRVSEFAKPGLQGLCGYVLLTNASVTVPLVQALHEAFTALHPEARFCVWDSASLNTMLHRHPHLARSRSQEMEKLCLQQVIAPLWKWVGEAFGVVGSWQRKEKTVWPWYFTQQQQIIPNDDIDKHYVTNYVPELVNSAPLPWPDSDRIYNYARMVAFPRSLEGIERLRDAFMELSTQIDGSIRGLAQELQRSDGPLHEFSHGERNDIALGLAIYAIEASWGYCPYRLSIHENKILVGQRYIFEGSGGLRAREPLDKLLSELRKRYQYGEKLPYEVMRARNKFANALFSLADQLWYPANIGMDAPRDATNEEVL